MEHFINEQVNEIRSIVGGDEVICGLSGGVDSSVVAALIQKAIGNQLTCIYVDHGLMRKNEDQMVKEMFKDHFKVNLVMVDAKNRFLEKLKGVTDPETKRKIIGNEFIEVFEEETHKLKNAKFLAQGTIKSDVIESGSKQVAPIKSHHNVGGLPEDMDLQLLEPLKTLYKNEVRELGLALGLPYDMVYRQPFPGPGLGIRIMGEIEPAKIEMVQESDYILRDEFAKADLDQKIWQYFTVLTNTKSVGVTNDKRTYEYVLAIRAVYSVDAMSADFAHIDFKILSEISERIINEVPGINRVVYDITAKPPGTIEWE